MLHIKEEKTMAKRGGFPGGMGGFGGMNMGQLMKQAKKNARRYGKNTTGVSN